MSPKAAGPGQPGGPGPRNPVNGAVGGGGVMSAPNADGVDLGHAPIQPILGSAPMESITGPPTQQLGLGNAAVSPKNG